MNLVTANPLQPTSAQLYWRLDKTGRLTPEEVLSPAQQSFFAPFPPAEMPRAAGTSWFRLSLAPYDGKNGPYYLDLNARVAGQIPKGERVWLLREGQPHMQLSTDTTGLYLLPDSTVPATIFIRTEGLPAVGFAPVLRSASTLTVLDTDGAFWIGIVLAVALIFGLLRGVFEQREWRMWAALYAGTLLVANAWGFPATPDGKVLLLDLPGLLAPGVALLLLPHVGRHILRSRDHSSILDIQFILIGLIGLVLCLLPLLSNHVWTIRYLPLWPLGMLLLLPTTLQAMFQKINGAGRFLTICLLPPLGLLSFGPLPMLQFTDPQEVGLWSGLVSLLPSLCLCASSLMIALAPTPKHVVKAKRVPTPGAGLEMPGKTGQSSPLRLEPVAAPVVSAPPLVLDDASRMTPPADVDSALPLHNLERRMRGPLDVLLNEIGTLEQMNLPRDLVDHAHRLSRAGRQLSLLIGEISSGRHISPVAIRQKSGMEAAAQTHAAPFDLYDVILQAHNAVAELAEAKNLALSWFTAPHLARTYSGQGDRLLRVLTLLAESAVHATDRGIVQIRVQRLPESNDPGLLLFTVSDTGKGAPPLQRSTISLVQVWELVGPTGGTLNVESGPTGTSIAFSMRFQALSAETAVRSLRDAASPSLRSDMCNALRILVVSDVPGSRQLLCYYLDELPHEVREARSVDEALGMYTQAPGALLIFDGDLPESDVVRAIAAIRAFEGENGYPLSSILALVKDDEQIERLRRAGCTHSLLKPVSRTELRQLALRLAPIPRTRAPHKPEPAQPAKQAQPNKPVPTAQTQPQNTQEIKRRPWSLLSMGSAEPRPEAAKPAGMPDLLPSMPKAGNVSDPKPISSGAKKAPLPELRSPLGAVPVDLTNPIDLNNPVSPPLETPVTTPAPTVPEATARTKVQPATRPVSQDAVTRPVSQDAVTRPVSQAATVRPVAQAAQTRPAPQAVPQAPVQPEPTPTAQILDDMVRDAEQKMAAQTEPRHTPGTVSAVSSEPRPAQSPSPVRRSPARQDSVRRAVAAASAERKPMPWPGSKPRSADSELSTPYVPGNDSEWVSEPRPIGSSGKRSEDVKQPVDARTARGTGQTGASLNAPRTVPQDAPRAVPLDAARAPSLESPQTEPEKPRGLGKSIFSLFQKKTPPPPVLPPAAPAVAEWVGEPRPKVARVEEPPRPTQSPAPREDDNGLPDVVQSSTLPTGGSERPDVAQSSALPTGGNERPDIVQSSALPTGGSERPAGAQSPALPEDSSEWVGTPRPKQSRQTAEIPEEPLSPVQKNAGVESATQLIAATRPHFASDSPDPLAPRDPLDPHDPLAPAEPVGPALSQDRTDPSSALTAGDAATPFSPITATPSAHSEQPRGSKKSRKEKARQEKFAHNRPARKPTFQPLLLPGLDEQAPVEAAAPNGLELRFSAEPEEPEVIFNLTEIVDDSADNDWPVLPVSSGKVLGHDAPLERPEPALHLEPADEPAPLPFAVHEALAPRGASADAAAHDEPASEMAQLRRVAGTPLPDHPGLELVELPDETPVEERLEQLDSLSARAQEAFQAGDIAGLRAAAERLAENATALGMHGLIDLARCLAEEAEDAESTASLLEIIAAAVRDEKQ